MSVRLAPMWNYRQPEYLATGAIAIANVPARVQLIASRGRIVAAADDTRRRIERDLHDGAQKRRVSLELRLRLAEEFCPA